MQSRKNLSDLPELLDEIDGFTPVSERLLEAIDRLMTRDIPALGRTTTTAAAAASHIESFFTAVETVLMRISAVFGNNLRPDRRHSDLLHKMTLSVAGSRPAVISPGMHGRLDELMRFRHFRRYYFHFDYDWDRLEYLIALVRRVAPEIARAFDRFRGYVSELVDRIA